MAPTFGLHTTGPEVTQAFPDQIKGRTFAITGASAGSLGAQTALYLASGHPGALLFLGRTEAKVTSVVKEISTISPSTIVKFIQIDLSSLSSVRQAASKIASSTPHIDVLINNAGIMGIPQYAKSVDGIEMQFASNHIGHFLLTNLLIPLIPAGGRIVNLSSAGHALGEVRFSDWNFDDGKAYDEWEAYGQSKAANVLFAISLAEKLAKKDVVAFSLHPGNIFGTGLAVGIGEVDWEAVMGRFAKVGRTAPLQKTLEEGCSTTLAAAVDPRLASASGAYLEDCNVSDAIKFCQSKENVEKLWVLSEQLVGQRFQY